MFSIFSIIFCLLLAAAFLAFAILSRDKNARITYWFWSAGFLAGALYDFCPYLHQKFSFPLAQTECLVLIWLLFLVLLYLGTLYIFVHRLNILLTYVLLMPVIIIPSLILLLPSRETILAVILNFFGVIPLEIVLGILAWFLGLSVFKQSWALMAYWLVGAAWFLFCVEEVLTGYFIAWGLAAPEKALEFQGVQYLGIIASFLLLVGFAILIIRRLATKKECF